MKKAKSLFFYLLLIGTLNNINYIFPEDVEKPEWFQKLEELKNTNETSHEKWTRMFKLLPPALQKKIKDDLYKPLNNTTFKCVNIPTKSTQSFINFPIYYGLTLPIPNPLHFLYNTFMASHQTHSWKEKNLTFASLAFQLEGEKYSAKILRTYLKKAWINLAHNLPSDQTFENKALHIMLQQLGDIVKLPFYPGYHSSKCVETTVFSNDN